MLQLFVSHAWVHHALHGRLIAQLGRQGGPWKDLSICRDDPVFDDELQDAHREEQSLERYDALLSTREGRLCERNAAAETLAGLVASVTPTPDPRGRADVSLGRLIAWEECERQKRARQHAGMEEHIARLRSTLAVLDADVLAADERIAREALRMRAPHRPRGILEDLGSRKVTLSLDGLSRFIGEAIASRIYAADIVMTLATPMADYQSWIRFEWEVANALRKPFLVVRMPEFLTVVPELAARADEIIPLESMSLRVCEKHAARSARASDRRRD